MKRGLVALVLAFGILSGAESVSMADFYTVPGVGDNAEGAGVAVGYIDGSPRPDMIVMAYDAAKGENPFRYWVGFNLSTSGATSNWGGWHQVSGVGNKADGAGIALTNIDSDPRPDLILMAYDDPKKANSFRYKVGMNLKSNGTTSNWLGWFQVDGVGWNAVGAGVAVGQIDGNDMPDLVFFANDKQAPDPSGFPYPGKVIVEGEATPSGAADSRFRIGFNVGPDGTARTWSDWRRVGSPGIRFGAGATMGNLDGDPRPELILVTRNDLSIEILVGYNIDGSGVVQSFMPTASTPGMGEKSDGGGAAWADINGNDRPDLIVLHYDDPKKGNTFRYQIGFDVNQYGTPAVWKP